MRLPCRFHLEGSMKSPWMKKKNRNVTLSVRIPASDRKIFQRCARDDERSLSAWVRLHLLVAARSHAAY